MSYGNIRELKAEYFPTDTRICNYFNFLHYPIQHQDEKSAHGVYGGMAKEAKQRIDEYLEMQKSTKEFKYKKDWFKIPSYTAYNFQKDIIENNEKNIDKYKITTGYGYYHSEICNADLFCGKGEWLINYRKYGESYTLPHIATLGVELVEERYNDCLNNKVKYCFNCAYEDFYINKEIISLLYFNPPYANEGKERLTKIYLEDIINKEYLVPCESFVDFVIREDDFKDCLDLILDHFTIIEESLFKAPSDEYSRFKQVVFTAKYKRALATPLDTKWSIQDRQAIKMSLLEKIDNLAVIDVTKLSVETLNNCRKLPSVQLSDSVQSIKLKENNKSKISEKNDISWNWFKDLTEIKTDTVGNITVPKKMKQGEIVNVLASGILNCQVGNHIVCGGTEQREETITSIQISNDGREFEQIEKRKINTPFFNILMPNGSIKKLLYKQEVPTESEE